MTMRKREDTLGAGIRLVIRVRVFERYRAIHTKSSVPLSGFLLDNRDNGALMP